MPVSGRAGFFRSIGAGVRLAEGLDAQLRSDLERYDRLLATLESVSASEGDAKALWALWRPDAVSVAEQEAFRKVLHDDNAVGDYYSFMGKRSSTLALVRWHLAQSSGPQTAKDIRVGMMLSQRPNGTFYDVPAGLRVVRDKWVLLQVRRSAIAKLEFGRAGARLAVPFAEALHGAW